MSGEPDQVKWRGVRPVQGIRGVWPARNATRFYGAGSCSGIAVVLMYTVPADKILYISSVMQSTRESAAAPGAAVVYVRDVLDATTYFITYIMFDTAGQLVIPLTYSPALEAAAGFDVCVANDHANIDTFVTFQGWLEDS